MEKEKISSTIYSQKQLTEGIFNMWLHAPEIVEEVKPGQFLMVYINDSSKLLPRPISICEIDYKNGNVRLVYRIVGKGTKHLSQYQSGESLKIMGPLGNGFPLKDKTALLVSGGIGIAPMLELVKRLKSKKHVVLGYHDKKMFLRKDFEKYAKVYVSTEDGSYGIEGNVIDAIKLAEIKADIIYACGPISMLRALRTYANGNNIQCYISLEERMACGIGACLGCVCRSKNIDPHSNVYNKRICKDGPVFLVDEVEF